jgi:hypothetical protein
MPTDHRAALAKIQRFDQLIAYLRDEMGWPIARDSFEDVDDLFYDFTADELGIDPKTAAKIESIKRLRPLSPRQRWGIFFVKFEPKKLPVVALRRILSQVALKKRASANSAERTAWAADDLLFVSNYGEGDERQITFAHFSQDSTKADLPILRVLGWNDRDTALHLDGVATELATKLSWPEDESNVDRWREKWRSAFTLRPDEVVKTSKALAVELAKLARKIHDRIRTILAIETENGPVTKLMKAFQEALVHDLDADGFADMYAQTIAYGLLSARVTNPRANTADGFAAQLPVTNPFLKELMETFLHVGGRKGKAGRGSGIDFDELGVSEVVELLDDANMEAVVHDFGDKNPQEDPVIHFYELFLKEYDAKKRLQRGVFYTPRPVVSYIVLSVHELLQTEFGLADGLADTTTWGDMAKRHAGLMSPKGVKPGDRFVTILDPATGTGTFLVEAIEVIHHALVEKWQREGHGEKKILDLWNDYVPKHLLPRLHGYELLMAPYAIAHLKIGLKLHETGYRFESDERARIYLTNALEPAHDFSGRFEFAIPALAHEAEAVNDVKRHQRFTVVIGNPPYSGHSANKGEWISKKLDDYYFVDGKPLGEKNPKWLQDDYVKFIRLAQQCITESGRGVLGFITNHSFLDNPTFRGMRQKLLANFATLRYLDLHGNSKKKETSPDGLVDENVFDIQQGVAISLLSKFDSTRSRRVFHADLFGSRESKYGSLAAASATSTIWLPVDPRPPFLLLFPQDSSLREEYEAGIRLPEAMPVNVLGFQTHRDHFAIDFEEAPLRERMAVFRDKKLTDDEVKSAFGIEDSGSWSVREARAALRSDKEWASRFVECAYRPFDIRYCFYSTVAADRPRRELLDHVVARQNLCLNTTRQTKAQHWGHAVASDKPTPAIFVELKDGSNVFPLWLYPERGGLGLSSRRRPNLSASFLKLLAAKLRLEAAKPHGLPSGLTPEDIFRYAYAVFHSPGYRTRYAEFLKIDFPRLPLTSGLELFRELARLGGELVALHLVEAPAQQAVFARYDKAAKAWRYEVAKGRRLPVSLSFNGPDKPVVSKVGWSDNIVWIDAVKPKKGAAEAKVTGSVGFRGVPEEVWSFHIGGYQVCEKWLKDRKDCTLTAADIAHYHRIVIALHETIRLMREIDEVIEEHGGWPGAFQGADASEEPAERVLKVAEPPGEYGSGKGEGKR